METWKTLSRRIILDHSRYLIVEEHTVELPDGRVISDWPWLVTPDYVNVVAVTQDEEFLCFRQAKYGVDGVSLAPVGGYIEPGEDPLGAARRELFEETGYRASSWVSLGRYRVDGNRGVGMAHLFLARAARRVAEPDADDARQTARWRNSNCFVSAAPRSRRRSRRASSRCWGGPPLWPWRC